MKDIIDIIKIVFIDYYFAVTMTEEETAKAKRQQFRKFFRFAN